MGNIKEKKQPMRRCTGCGEHFPKNELIRVLRTPEGEITVDFHGKKSGRGAYICPKIECFSKARRSKRIASSLEMPIPEEIYEKLEEEIRSGIR